MNFTLFKLINHNILIAIFYFYKVEVYYINSDQSYLPILDNWRTANFIVRTLEFL